MLGDYVTAMVDITEKKNGAPNGVMNIVQVWIVLTDPGTSLYPDKNWGCQLKLHHFDGNFKPLYLSLIQMMTSYFGSIIATPHSDLLPIFISVVSGAAKIVFCTKYYLNSFIW